MSNLAVSNKSLDLKPVEGLTIEEVENLLPLLDTIEDWVKKVKIYATDLAKNGEKFKGYKLVEGRGRRIINDSAAVINELSKVTSVDTFSSRELFGIKDLELALSAEMFRTYVEPHINYIKAGPSLVPEADKRPELVIVKSAAEDFKGDYSDILD